MNYFAYGSNLCVKRLRYRGANPSNPRMARLPDYELTFNKRSLHSTKANIVPHTGSEVFGVIFHIDDDRLEGLRHAEGYPTQYAENPIAVEVDGATESVTAYVACDDWTIDSGHPFSWYLNHIINGAEAFNFPAEYIARLRQVQAIEDPNVDQERHERAFW